MKTASWNAIRTHYRRNCSDIMQAGQSDWGIDPYAWDHEAGIRLTPIEQSLWSEIRAVGAVMYPQYPVGRFFVDFANPVARVAIECDGAKFHLNPNHDAMRQAEIEAEGWTMYRITGRDCNRYVEAAEDEDGRRKPAENPGYRFVKEIAERHSIVLMPRPECRPTQQQVFARIFGGAA
jgi:hypothetical protein